MKTFSKALRSKLTMACALTLVGSAMVSTASAVTYIEAAGVVVGEGELFTRRTNAANGGGFRVVPAESASTGTFTNARGGSFVQILPDGTAGSGGPTAAPSIEYDMLISTTGTYQLFVRWEGNGTNSTTQGASDSIFADIVQFKDGAGGVPDWYELSQAIDGNFATNPWDALGGFEENVAGPSNSNMLWTVTTPGLYTMRFSSREDGAAVDAFVLQLSTLPAPTGTGPTISAIVIPEPATATLGLLSVAGLMLRRRREA